VLVPMLVLMLAELVLVHGRSGMVCKLSYINFLVCVR
jgi:hypothetical protein